MSEPTRFDLLRDMRTLRDCPYDQDVLFVPHADCCDSPRRGPVRRGVLTRVPFGSAGSIRFPDGVTCGSCDFIGWLPLDYGKSSPRRIDLKEGESLVVRYTPGTTHRIERSGSGVAVVYRNNGHIAKEIIEAIRAGHDVTIPDGFELTIVSREAAEHAAKTFKFDPEVYLDTRTVGVNAEATSNAPLNGCERAKAAVSREAAKSGHTIPAGTPLYGTVVAAGEPVKHDAECVECTPEAWNCTQACLDRRRATQSVPRNEVAWKATRADWGIAGADMSRPDTGGALKRMLADAKTSPGYPIPDDVAKAMESLKAGDVIIADWNGGVTISGRTVAIGYTAAEIRQLRPDWTNQQVAAHVGTPLGALPTK